MTSKITSQFVKERFPNSLKFAFLSEYVVKSSLKRRPNIIPDIDLVLITENSRKFHFDNYKLNKSDYPLISKILSVRIINFFQVRGAKIHYNFFNLDKQVVRYSVIDWNDFQRDLAYWENLTASAFMHKPYVELLNTEKDKIDELQNENLKSATSYALLTLLNPNTSNKDSKMVITLQTIIERILSIPVQNSRSFSLYSNDFNLKEVLEDCSDDLVKIFLPYLKRYSNIIYDEDKQELLLENSLSLREELIEDLPSILTSGLIVLETDNLKDVITKDSRLDSLKLSYDKKMRKALVNNFTHYKQLFIINAVNRILCKHRNTRVSFFFLSKWFFIGFWVFKFLVKVMIVFIIYKKR